MSAQRKYYEYEEEDYEEVPLSHEEEIKSLKVRSKEPLFKTVVDTATRSHCQILFLVAAVMALLVTVGSGVSASRGYALVATQNQAEQLEQENERLRIENAKLKSPQRIKDIAEGELGMTVPKKIYFAHEN
ncbi:MAG: cell division protein FtsL [Selenomonas ruminantium]|jgi:cell division protein FtsL|nr:cell division protein FtsL [Selenomonas ruminantium]